MSFTKKKNFDVIHYASFVSIDVDHDFVCEIQLSIIRNMLIVFVQFWRTQFDDDELRFDDDFELFDFFTQFFQNFSIAIFVENI